MTQLVAVRPHILHEPPGIVGTSGDEAVEFAETCGIELDDWQSWAVRMCLSERAGGKWAAFENAVITPRQNGKNYILRVIQLACLFVFGDKLLLHSAHQWDTVNVHRHWLMDLLESHDEFATLLKPVDRRTGRSKSFVNINGDEQIQLTNGRSAGTDRAIVFKTRSAGKTRGFTGDKLFLDEAQRLGAGSMGDSIPTLSSRPSAQVYYTGSAPNETSRVLHSVINRARSGDPDDRLFCAYWGNDETVLDLEPGSPEHLEAIRNANPAVGADRITEDYIIQEIRTFSGDPELVEEHRRERLGVASTLADKAGGTPIPEDRWQALEQAGSVAGPNVRVAFDQSTDRRYCTFGLAGERLDGFHHVETRDRRPGDDWVVARGAQLAEGHRTPIILIAGSNGMAFKARFEQEGVPVDVITVAEAAESWGRFIMATTGLTPTIRHHGQPEMRISVEAARTVTNSHGVELLSSKKSSTDITPLTTTVAAFGRLCQPAVVEYTGGVHDLADYLDNDE